MPPPKKEKNPLYKSNKDYAYEQWKKSLPENLREESPYYNLRGAWEAGLEPEMFYRDKEDNFRTAHKPHPFNPKYEPHLSSRNPYTGEILKDPRHDTYDMAIEGDIKMGYHPTIDLKTGKMYSISPNDSPTKGPFKNFYANGGSSIEAKKDATLVVGNQPKPSFKENKKNPVKDISKDILPLPGFRDKPEDTELIKLIKERQIKPRGPKQPYELASGAVTPTASPIDAAVVGAAGIPQLVGRGVAGALPYLDAPLTVGSKVLPSVTANNLLNAAQAAYSGEQIINPESDLRTNPNPENILMTGLGLVGTGIGRGLMNGARQTGKYLFNTPKQLPVSGNITPLVNTAPTPWSMQELPGLHLKSTMTGSPLEKQLSKTGQIDVNNIRAYIGKADVGSQDKFIIDKVLNEKFTGQKKIDYNSFRNAVSDELIPLNRTEIPDFEHTNWGLNRLGYTGPKLKNVNLAIKTTEEHISSLEKQLDNWKNTDDVTGYQQLQKELAETKNKLLENQKLLENLPLENRTFTFSNAEKFGRGDTSHFTDPSTLGHTRTLVSKEEPHISHVLESQSDFYQNEGRTALEKLKEIKEKNVDVFAKRVESTNRQLKQLEEDKKVLADLEYRYKNNLPDDQGYPIQEFNVNQFRNIVNSKEKTVLLNKAELENWQQKLYLGKAHQERFLQENIRQAVENGQTTMRYPTSETAAKIQGYTPTIKAERLQDDLDNLKYLSRDEDFLKIGDNDILPINDYGYKSLSETPLTKREYLEKLNNRISEYQKLPEEELNKKIYTSQHQTILNKYNEAPKMIKKTIGVEPKLVTDSKGNSWYEFDIPEGFKGMKGEIKAFSMGGITTIPTTIIGAAASQKQEYKYGGNIPMKLNKYNYGGNMYPNGGNTLYVDNPNDPRLQAYEDSLKLYNYNNNRLQKLLKLNREAGYDQKIEYSKVLPKDVYNSAKKITQGAPKKMYKKQGINLDFESLEHYEIDPINSWKLTQLYDTYKAPSFIKNMGLFNDKSEGLVDYGLIYKKPVQEVILQKSKENTNKPKLITNTNKPKQQINNNNILEYQKLDKMLPIRRTIDNNSNNIIDSVLRSTQEVTTPKVFVDEYTNYNNPNIPKGRIKYGKGKTEEFAYGGNMYFPYGGASILTQSNLETGEAQAKENTVLDKDKKTKNTKPVISNPSLYSGKQKQVDTAGTISNIGSDISKEVNKYSYKPISTTPINYNLPNSIKMDTSTAPPPTTSLDQLGQGPELNLDIKTNTFSESLAPEIKTNIQAPTIENPSTTGKTSSFGSKAASNAGGSTATALNIGNQIYNATKNVDDTYNQDLAGNEKYNKEYSQAQEKYKKDQSIVDTTATTLSTIGTVMSAIPVVNAFSWIPMLLGAGTKAIGDPIVDADYESNAREASLRNFNMVSPEEYNRSMKVSNKNILAPESNQARYGGKMFSYGGNIYKNGGMTMYNMPKGLTHEQHPYGGYPIGNNNYVESDEVVIDKPDGSKYIFSNRIKYKI